MIIENVYLNNFTSFKDCYITFSDKINIFVGDDDNAKIDLLKAIYCLDEKFYISWDEFHHDVKAVCQKIRQKGEYNKIVAISRGGLIPAGIIAYELDIRQTAVVNVVTYIGEKHKKLDSLVDDTQAGATDEKTLIIDDLADSGQTMRLLRASFPLATRVVIYTKPKGQGVADIFARELPDKWVVFPWDVE